MGTTPAAHPAPRIGDVIAGKYELRRILGEGGMGIVFEATHVRMRQRVAVKMLLPEMLAMPEVVARFEREARAAGQLRSRHAARVVDVDVTAEGLPYMVMEFLEGHDLGTELESRVQLPYPEAVDCVLQACVGMGEAHGLGIVHRDLKPSNLFLAREEDRTCVKIVDFGISKVTSETEKLTAAETVMGTAMYMSPEQVRSARNVDARADVWSLGVILYELLSGQPPWTGSTTQIAAAIVTDDPAPLARTCNVPPGLEAVILKALRRKPAERHQDVRELAAELLPFAPEGGLGRASATTLLSPSSARSLPTAPPAEVAVADRTIPDAGADLAPARSRREGGTAPGWSQPGATRARRRTMFGVLAGAIAVVVGVSAVAVTLARRPSGPAGAGEALAVTAS
ncbi:MAG: serine/threonine protein kinase, partial [Myxococcales bacterium]|nr:serine/threonine protein kinase [Myxococcales bacterium]